MTILPVDIGIPIEGYPTPEAAIAAADRHPRQSQARSDAAHLAGERFTGARCSFSRWSMQFTGSLWLDISCGHGEVVWSVQTAPHPMSNEVSEAYALQWPSGLQSTIDVAQLISDRVGREFWQLYVNECGLYVYLRRKPILSFAAVPRTDNGDWVLSVCDDN